MGLEIDREQRSLAGVSYTPVIAKLASPSGSVTGSSSEFKTAITNASTRWGCEAIMTSGNWREIVACN